MRCTLSMSRLVVLVLLMSLGFSISWAVCITVLLIVIVTLARFLLVVLIIQVVKRLTTHTAFLYRPIDKFMLVYTSNLSCLYIYHWVTHHTFWRLLFLNIRVQLYAYYSWVLTICIVHILFIVSVVIAIVNHSLVCLSLSAWTRLLLLLVVVMVLYHCLVYVLSASSVCRVVLRHHSYLT